MISDSVLRWLGIISSGYILLPVVLVWQTWPGHDVIRRRVAWYVLFNACFSLITYITNPILNNIVVFYVASPLYMVLVYRVFDPLATVGPAWLVLRGAVAAYCLFVVIDMVFLEDFWNEFSRNIYLPEKAIIICMAFYFFYCFSREARTDYSSLWIGLGIGFNALLNFFLLAYTPYIGFQPNTVGYFVWFGLGSIISLISYSFVAYGLWIARMQRPQQPTRAY